jgi:hypothetical protein
MRSDSIYTASHTELPELIAPTVLVITSWHGLHRKHPISNRNSTVACVHVAAGTCLPSHWAETVAVQSHCLAMGLYATISKLDHYSSSHFISVIISCDLKNVPTRYKSQLLPHQPPLVIKHILVIKLSWVVICIGNYSKQSQKLYSRKTQLTMH